MSYANHYTTWVLAASLLLLQGGGARGAEVEKGLDGGGGEHQAAVWSLGVEVACFCLAFALIRAASKKRGGKGPTPAVQKKVLEPAAAAAEGSSGVLAAWRSQKKAGLGSTTDLQVWAGRLLSAAPELFVSELVPHIAGCSGGQGQARDSASLLLDVAAKAGRPDVVEATAEAVNRELGKVVDVARLRLALLGAHAAAGNESKVEELMKEEAASCRDGKPPLRTYALVIRGYLKASMLQAAVAKLHELRKHGHEVPPRAVVELVQAANRMGAAAKILDWLGDGVAVPADGIASLLDGAANAESPELAERVVALAKAQGTALTEDSYESLLKVYARIDEDRAIELFRGLQEAGFTPCEGLCRYLVARCADCKNVRLAEEIAGCLRARREMTFATYKTLMKVYAYAGLYDKACDLYAEIKQNGMEPDSVMYGSLVKFAVKAGRTALSQELFEKAGEGGCVQNYMWLIRSAGQDGDVARALSVFRKLQQVQPDLVDVMAFNITIDACASNKALKEALALVEEMKAAHALNIVTYNTLMKGHCLVGDLRGARLLLKEMEGAGIEPDSASFSCLLSGAAKVGDLMEAWTILTEMGKRDIPPDSFVVSIMMQAARKALSPQDADKALTVLDRPDVNICEDEIVFNTVLDACIFRRDRRRLARAVDLYAGSQVKASVRTYGLLIKGCAVLKRTKRCWELWSEMTEQKGILPNDITLGCMIDALVEGNQVDEALALFQDWKQRVKCDTIIYSTLIKGFAQIGDADRAMALYRDMRASGVQMNSIVYTALINAHARNGLMKRAEALLEDMEREGCQPNSITYSSMVKGYCVRGDLQGALDIFHKMLGLGFPADAVVYNTLLDGCVQQQNFELGQELLDQMKMYNVEPSNYTLSIMVKMRSKQGELGKAFEVLRTALADPKGSKIDAQLGACIVGACIHNKAPERALDVFAEMKTWPHFDGPDANTYSALISGLPRFGYLRRSVEIAEEACVALRSAAGQDRRPLAANALQQLFRAIRSEGLMAELGLPLADKLRGAGMGVEQHWLSQAPERGSAERGSYH